MKDMLSRPLPRRVVDLEEGWLEEALRTCGLVPRQGRLAIEISSLGAARSGTGELARIRWRTEAGGAGAGSVVAKLANASAGFERCEREARFYRELAAESLAPLPCAWLTEVDPDGRAVFMLLEDVSGRDGDAGFGCTEAEAAAVVDALAGMHAKWWRQEAVARFPWLPRWGQGEAGAARPHAHAAERYRRQLGRFMRHYGDGVVPTLIPVIESLCDRYEEILREIAGLPTTLIHGDLHLDNIVFGTAGATRPVTILDWQWVSCGPAVYDLARFLGDSLRGPRRTEVIARLLGGYGERLRAGGVDAGDVAGLVAQFPLALLRTLAGLISGYGTRPPATLHEREVRLVRRSVSAEGLAGVVVAMVE